MAFPQPDVNVTPARRSAARALGCRSETRPLRLSSGACRRIAQVALTQPRPGGRTRDPTAAYPSDILDTIPGIRDHLLPPPSRPIKGRGAISNATGRFEAWRRERDAEAPPSSLPAPKPRSRASAPSRSSHATTRQTCPLTARSTLTRGVSTDASIATHARHTPTLVFRQDSTSRRASSRRRTRPISSSRSSPVRAMAAHRSR